jgi:hypothetical protein
MKPGTRFPNHHQPSGFAAVGLSNKWLIPSIW